LDFASYNGNSWRSLPDFANGEPESKGVANHFALAYRARSENTALIFRGYIEIPSDGTYTFS
jgi:hypothetical protein